MRKSEISGTLQLMKFFEWAAFLLASILPGGDSVVSDPGVTIHIPSDSSLVAEEQTEIRIGDKFSAAVMDPATGEIFSQSEWVEVTK